MMDSYSKGRPRTQRFHVAMPSQKTPSKTDKKEDFPEEGETVVKAVPDAPVKNAPQVDLVMREGAVRKIVIHMEGGMKLELDCVYEDEE